MIPKQLELTNFLSYRQHTTLNFEQIHIAGISGQNGSGKSSLMEAMTWALFGKSRTRSDDDVVNKKAAVVGEKAQVRFTFDLDGAEYRVIRAKKAGGRGSLEFQMAAAGGWTTLSETKLRETQAAIEQTLGMNYDTFVNVSFFLQGKADEFTTKTAGRRKEILAELLGVNKWDAYKDRVANERKREEGQLLLVDSRIEDVDTELGEEEVRAADLNAARAAAEKLKIKEEAQANLVNDLRRRAEAVGRQRTLVTQLQGDEVALTKKSAETQTTLQTRQTERDRHQAILDEKATIEAALADYQQADTAYAEWQAKREQFNQLTQQARPHELAIAQTRSALQQQQTSLTQRQDGVAQMRTEREGVVAAQTANQTELDGVTVSLNELASQEIAQTTAREKLQALENERKLVQQTQKQLWKESAEIDKLSREKPKLEQTLTQLGSSIGQLSATVAAATAQRTQLTTIQTEQQTIQKNEQPRLKADMNKIKMRMERLSAEAGGTCPLCGQELTATHLETVLADLRGEGKRYGDAYRQNQTRFQAIELEVKTLTMQLKQAESAEKELPKAQRQQAETETRLTALQQQIETWQASGKAAELTKFDAILAETTELDALKAEVKQLASALEAKPKLTKKQQQLQHELATQTARLAEIDRAVADWDSNGQKLLADVAAQLKNSSFEAEARASLSAIQKEQTAVGYDAEAHKAVGEQRKVLAAAPKRQQQLLQAAAAVKPLDDAIADLNKQVAELGDSAEKIKDQLATAKAQLGAQEADAGDLRSAEDQLSIIREEFIEANRQVGTAEQRFNIIGDQRDRRIKLLTERETITQRIARLRQLEKACGRDGVQALLIERALPEIEDSANELLDRLSNGEMRIWFNTQKALKSDKSQVRETLDISIMDSNGERPYENFSGGEQFRINFALRLALSRVLAQRADARLQTLVIDEGFGSQDPNGRQRLVEAINTIQKDFQCILVITHIDELREAFPTRIEITKTSNGSQISLIGQ